MSIAKRSAVVLGSWWRASLLIMVLPFLIMALFSRFLPLSPSSGNDTEGEVS